QREGSRQNSIGGLANERGRAKTASGVSPTRGVAPKQHRGSRQREGSRQNSIGGLANERGRAKTASGVSPTRGVAPKQHRGSRQREGSRLAQRNEQRAITGGREQESIIGTALA